MYSMRKVISAIAAVIILSSTAAFAQKDAQAKTILGQVSKKYKAYATVKTDFRMTMASPQNETQGSQSGTLVSQSGTGKYRVTLFSPAGKSAVDQEIVSDGKTQWTYQKRDNEVQVTNADHTATGLNPATLFTMYEKGYKYLYTGDQKQGGNTYQAIELSPTAASPAIFKVKLLIDKTAKLIYSAQLFDKNGNRYTYLLSNFVPNPKVAGDYFTFSTKAHPGVNVEDLR